jgi:hypothetical protein
LYEQGLNSNTPGPLINIHQHQHSSAAAEILIDFDEFFVWNRVSGLAIISKPQSSGSAFVPMKRGQRAHGDVVVFEEFGETS